MKWRNEDWDCSLTVKPGEGGTLGPYRKHGDALICVRYRYNKRKDFRIKTVELIEEIAKVKKKAR